MPLIGIVEIDWEKHFNVCNIFESTVGKNKKKLFQLKDVEIETSSVDGLYFYQARVIDHV